MEYSNANNNYNHDDHARQRYYLLIISWSIFGFHLTPRPPFCAPEKESFSAIAVQKRYNYFWMTS